MQPGTFVPIEKRKWPDRFMDRGEEVFLGEDEHGRWFGAPARRPVLGRDGRLWQLDWDAAVCYPREGWWNAIFTDPLGSFRMWSLGTAERPSRSFEIGPREIYVHIATPATFEAPVAYWVDLELDVIRDAAGSIAVVDEDEFVEANLPEDVADAARRACDQVAKAMHACTGPFDGVGTAWLSQVAAYRDA